MKCLTKRSTSRTIVNRCSRYYQHRLSKSMTKWTKRVRRNNFKEPKLSRSSSRPWSQKSEESTFPSETGWYSNMWTHSITSMVRSTALHQVSVRSRSSSRSSFRKKIFSSWCHTELIKKKATKSASTPHSEFTTAKPNVTFLTVFKDSSSISNSFQRRDSTMKSSRISFNTLKSKSFITLAILTIGGGMMMKIKRIWALRPWWLFPLRAGLKLSMKISPKECSGLFFTTSSRWSPISKVSKIMTSCTLFTLEMINTCVPAISNVLVNLTFSLRKGWTNLIRTIFSMVFGRFKSLDLLSKSQRSMKTRWTNPELQGRRSWGCWAQQWICQTISSVCPPQQITLFWRRQWPRTCKQALWGLDL